MPLHTSDNTIELVDVVTVEEAETLATWLRQHPDGAADLAACTHLHTAALQALLAAKPTIAAGPTDPFLNRRILPWLTSGHQTVEPVEPGEPEGPS